MDGKAAFRATRRIVSVDRRGGRGAADAEGDAVLGIRHSEGRALQIDRSRRELKRYLERKHGGNLSGFASLLAAIIRRRARAALQRHCKNKVLIDQAAERVRLGA